MTDKAQPFRRRKVLKTIGGTGAAVVGAGALTGSALAHGKGSGQAVAYMAEHPDEGEQFELGPVRPGPEHDREVCDQRGNAPGHKINVAFVSEDSDLTHVSIQSNSLNPEEGDSLKVVAVLGECSQEDPDTGQTYDRIRVEIADS